MPSSNRENNRWRRKGLAAQAHEHRRVILVPKAEIGGTVTVESMLAAGRKVIVEVQLNRGEIT